MAKCSCDCAEGKCTCKPGCKCGCNHVKGGAKWALNKAWETLKYASEATSEPEDPCAGGHDLQNVGNLPGTNVKRTKCRNCNYRGYE